MLKIEIHVYALILLIATVKGRDKIEPTQHITRERNSRAHIFEA